ncbi:hypothetical protein EX30DRAFT_192142 [Ascodesmis nigricans]|uniref:Cyclin-like protein n=1 Tax=Ascodesmis nigricans TaxID=341454 RepID=A0A4S2N0H6_9PEZI|nr:hypothetical protein EX30DRAFT_192142 [Ascodesmis nigricans]
MPSIEYGSLKADPLLWMDVRVAPLPTEYQTDSKAFPEHRRTVNMPVIYTPPNRHPLTPPEYPYDAVCGMPVNQYQYAVNPHKAVYGGYDAYRKASTFAAAQQAADYRHPYMNSQASHYPLPAPPGLHHPTGQFAHHKRSSIHSTYEDAYPQPTRQESRPEPPAAEEKPTGGVSAHLDYEMDEMTEFVGSVALELVTGQPSSRLMPSYRKFVNQILSSTRLPSSTILLGMAYLRQRMDIQQPAAPRGQDHVYRHLTIALLLASKFLDDNTFQNKSWSEVTSLKVKEINELEKDWLAAINWQLHIDVDGHGTFRNHKSLWDNWKARRAAKAAQPILAPIDTYRSRSNSAYAPPQMYTQYPPTPVHSTASEQAVQLPPVRVAHRDEGQWWNSSDYSPPSAPQTGPATPEGYYGWSAAYSRPQQPAPEYSRLPPIMSTYDHRVWPMHNHAPINCFCQNSDQRFWSNVNYGPPIAA